MDYNTQNSTRPQMAIVSSVLPFPGHAGQQQRVHNKLIALRQHFHLTFITGAAKGMTDGVRAQLLELCDEALVLPSRYANGRPTKLYHQARAVAFHITKGLKRSNYIVGRVEFPAERLAELLTNYHFDVALFEYWHASAATAAFHRAGIPCVLDMHNILWQSYQRQLTAQHLPQWWRERQVRRYRQQEESAWRKFDALITINTAEHNYVRAQLPDTIPLFYAPMGIDLEQWPYSWRPVCPPRVAYYGGLGSPHNQRDALRAYKEIMPLVWQNFPDVEFWLVGSNPPDVLQTLPQQDSRVHVTGFVEDVQAVLETMSLVLCPWSGRYGFRSRLVEAMALGVTVVTTPDAVYGMNLEDGRGLLLAETNASLAESIDALLQDAVFLRAQSRQARLQIEQQYSFESTYDCLAGKVQVWSSTVSQCKKPT